MIDLLPKRDWPGRDGFGRREHIEPDGFVDVPYAPAQIPVADLLDADE